jgi:monoamine oxidase
MTRKEFIEKSMKMGMSLPFISAFMMESCSKDELVFPDFKTDFTGKVIIVGAGVAGLSAAYLLKRYNVDFEIIEAAPVLGGRLKKVEGFADFPIDTGAEWIHYHPSILADILNNPQTNAQIDIVVYNPQTIKTWHNNKLKSHHYFSGLYSEWKFKSSTWFDFFEEFVVPEIADKIRLNKPVVEINHGGSRVQVKTSDQEIYEADRVLVTTSVKILQNELIQFHPALPADKKQALNQVFMGDGIKVFIEFRERFYPDVLAFGSILKAMNEDEKFYYDAAFRKDSSKNILALFAINEKASAYTALGSDSEIIQKVLDELDEIFEGKASPAYLKHEIQNWSSEPYIQGAYSYSFKGDKESIVKKISEPVSGQLYFGGEALSLDFQSTVHGAVESGYQTIERMLKA